MAITYQTVIDLFESSFSSKEIIPEDLEMVWFKRAVGRYSFEISPIQYNEKKQEIDSDNMIVADTLALYMLLFWKERDKAKINMRGQIVTKDISLNGGGAVYTAAKNDYETILEQLNDLITKQKHPAWNEGD